jgi:FkbM family methyltransferase
MLYDNLKNNNIKNVILNKLALSDKKGFATLYSKYIFGSTDSSLKSLDKNPLKYKVNTTTIDHYCEKKQIKPKIIKIDVEGGELQVIKGARKTLQTKGVILVLEQHNNYLTEKEKNELWVFLKKILKTSFIYKDNQVYTNQERVSIIILLMITVK